MDSTNYITLGNQTALRRQLDMIAHNLANAETMAYKAERPIFTEFLERIGDQRPLSFVQDFGAIRDLADGPLVRTGNPFDLAIQGDAYFVLQTDAGPRYTRNGHFTLNADRQLVTTAGDPVLDVNDQPIEFGPDDNDIAIAPDGTISGDLGQIGRIQLVAFAAPRQLEKAGDSLFRAVQEPIETRDAHLTQGMLERSNVKPIMELTNMIKVHRAYQSNNKLIDTDEDLQRKTIDRIMRV